MPILGVIASQISGHLFAPSGAYDSIATTTVGAGGTTSITFSSIPATYTHLQIRCFGTIPAGSTNIAVRFNGDTASNYWWHQLYGDGSTTGSNNASSLTTFMYVSPMNTQPGAVIVDVLDYANTNKYKVLRGLGGADTNGAGGITMNSGMWNSTTAITSVTIYGATYGQYSSFALYGIKGA